MNTALDDELIRGRNPCRIKGADQEHAPERPTISVEQVYAIAAAIKPRYRALVLTAATTGLRWGELMGLRRKHVDLAEGFLSVTGSVVEVGRSLEFGRTKSAAGVRAVGIPSIIVPELSDHLDQWAEAGPTVGSSSAPRVQRLVGRTSTGHGAQRSTWRVKTAFRCRRAFTFTTCGTRRMGSPQTWRVSES